MDLLYRELLNLPNCPVAYQGDSNALDASIDRIATDSRTVQSGDTFIALPGDKFDGHSFISKARAVGVKNFIVSEAWYDKADESDRQGNFFIVTDTLSALQEIGRCYREKFQIPVIALTGSNGKTTTKEMMAAVLSEKFQVLKNLGNLNNHIGVPLSLLGLTSNHEIAVIEMGTNHFGEIARLAEIANPTAGLITNIGPAHLEFFKSLEGVYRAKTELWQFLERHESRIAFVNSDDSFLGKYKPTSLKVITFGLERPADVTGQFLRLDDEGRPVFSIDGLTIKLGIAGIHNISNALAAAAVGLEFGVTLDQIKVALERFSPSSKRMEIIRDKGITIINDCYNSNPESARKSLLTLSQMQTQGRRIAMLADMLELGNSAEEAHREIGEYLASLKNIHYLLTYGRHSKFTSDTARNTLKKQSIHFETKTEMIDTAKRIMRKGDVLLIKGSRGMAMEEVTQGIIEA